MFEIMYLLFKMNEITKEQAFEAIKNINHPVIDCTLVDLGVVKDIEINEDQLSLIIALPFIGLPAYHKQAIVDSLKQELEEFGKQITVQYVLMSEEEKRNFLFLEHAYWKKGFQPQSG